jgi:hypothetical protein
MHGSFWMKLADIQPSQLYISEQKLFRVLDGYPNSLLEALPVKRLEGKVIFTDGHTRAFLASLMGLSKINVYWDQDDLDWQAYQICVDWCIQADIRKIDDLAGHVVTEDQYAIKWLQRCNELHRRLEIQRNSEYNSSRIT